MNKKIKYIRNGAIAGGIGFGLYNVIDQLLHRKDNHNFNWKELALSFLKGVGIGGAIGLSVGAISDYLNEAEQPIDTDAVLLGLIDNIRLMPYDPQYLSLKEKSDWLICIIQQEFSDVLKRPPCRFGSTEKGTALKNKYDIDVFVPFKPDGFSSISDMFHCLLEVLNKYEGSNGIIEVRDQRKSIGVVFKINGNPYKVDVVPQKGTRGSRTSGYLFVNNKGLLATPSRQKTDIQLQNAIKLSEIQKKILIILKEWKNKKALPISSHLLQYLVLEAYNENKGRIPRKFTDKIVMTLVFIQDNIETIALSSIENTNNILTDISKDDKYKIYRECKSALEDFEYQKNTIIDLVK